MYGFVCGYIIIIYRKNVINGHTLQSNLLICGLESLFAPPEMVLIVVLEVDSLTGVTVNLTSSMAFAEGLLVEGQRL